MPQTCYCCRDVRVAAAELLDIDYESSEDGDKDDDGDEDGDEDI